MMMAAISALLVLACFAGPEPDSTSDPHPRPSEGGIIVESDWSRGGVTDGGLWTDLGLSSGFEVRSTATDRRDFPTPNYLRVSNTFAHQDLQGVPVPAPGESLCGQMYFRNMLTTSEDAHGYYHDGNREAQPNWGPALFGFYLLSPGSGSFYVSLGDHEMETRYFYGGPIRPGVTYRLDWCIRRVDSQHGRAEMRVYDVDGSLLYDDFNAQDYHQVDLSLDDYLWSAGESRWQSLAGWRIGLEAGQGGGGTSSEIARQRFCTDWCPS